MAAAFDFGTTACADVEATAAFCSSGFTILKACVVEGTGFWFGDGACGLVKNLTLWVLSSGAGPTATFAFGSTAFDDAEVVAALAGFDCVVVRGTAPGFGFGLGDTALGAAGLVAAFVFGAAVLVDAGKVAAFSIFDCVVEATGF